MKQDSSFGGGLSRPTFNPEDSSFVFGLCQAGGMAIVSPLGNPDLLMPRGTHGPDDLPGRCTSLVVDSGDDLSNAFAAAPPADLD